MIFTVETPMREMIWQLKGKSENAPPKMAIPTLISLNTMISKTLTLSSLFYVNWSTISI